MYLKESKEVYMGGKNGKEEMIKLCYNLKNKRSTFKTQPAQVFSNMKFKFHT